LPDILRLKRRTSGAAGAPGSLLASEVAFNEVDETLWYGKGNAGGFATSIIPIAGSGAFPALGDGRWVKKTGDQMSGGLSFGQRVISDGNPLNLTQHLSLFDGWGGFSVTSGNLNLVSGGMLTMSFNGAGANLGVDVGLYLDHDPVNAMEAVPLRYLQNNYSTNAQGDARWVNTNGDTMTGSLAIQGNLIVSPGSLSVSYDVTFGFNGAGYAAIYMNAGPSTNRITYYQTNGVTRWLYGVDAAGETGANAGSGFFLSAYSDTGQGLFNSFYFSRATGLGTVAGDPTDPLGIATKRYVDNHQPLGGPYLPIAGGTVTGNLAVNGQTDVKRFTFSEQNGGPMPGGGYGALTWNTDGGGDVAIVNGCNWASAGFSWYQVGASTWSRIMYLGNSGNLSLQGVGISYNLGGGTNLMGFKWEGTPNKVHAYVDGTPVGTLATMGDLGAYLPTAGGTMTGQLSIANNQSFQFNDNAGTGVRMVVGSDNHFGIYSTNAAGVGTVVWDFYARTDNPAQSFHLTTNFYGHLYAWNGISWSGGDFSQGSIYTDANWGGLFRGRAGTNSDLAFADRDGTSVLYIRYPNHIDITGTAAFTSTVALGVDPVLDMEAVTLRYLRANYATTGALGNYVAKSGDTMSGVLTVNAQIGVNQFGSSLNIYPGAGQGAWNGITQANDTVLMFTRGSLDTGALTLTTWGNIPIGIRIDSPSGTIGMTAANGVSVSGGLRFGQVNVPPTDTSKHIRLYDGGVGNHYGFSTSWDGVSIARLNYVVTEPGHTYHSFWNGSLETVRIGPSDMQVFTQLGVTISGPLSVGGETTTHNIYNDGTVGIMYRGLGDTNWYGFKWDGTNTHVIVNGWDSGNIAVQSWVTNNFAPATGSGVYVSKVGDTMSGGLRINYTPTDTSAQLWLSPTGGFLGKSIIRFSGTFAPETGDGGPRYVASIRSGFVSNAWGYEHVDIWLTNTANDANSDAGQTRAVRFTLNQTTFDTPVTINRNLLVNGVGNDPVSITVPNGNWARYFSTVTGVRTWAAGTRNDGVYIISDENVQAFRFIIDTSGNATILQGLWVGTSVNVAANLSVSGGINLNNGVSGPSDSSRGITFWGSPNGTNYSIVVSDSTLNYNVNNVGDKHDFRSGGIVRLRVSDTINTYVPTTFNNDVTVNAQFNVHNLAAAKYLSIMPNLGGGAYNGIVQTGDHAILVSAGAPDTGAISIMPWSNSALGIRIDGAAHTIRMDAAGGIIHNADHSWFRGTNTQIDIDGPTGQWRTLQFNTSTVSRWNIQMTPSDHFAFTRFNDSGAPIDNPITISRTNAAIALSGPLTVNSTSTHVGQATFQNGIYMNNYVGVSNDVARGLNMYGGAYGLTISGGRLNVVGSSVYMVSSGATDWAHFDDGGLAIHAGDVWLARDPSNPAHATTKQYVDQRTTQLIFATIATLRAYTGSVALTNCVVQGYYGPADGGEGFFVYVSTDTTSLDNGGTIIRDGSGRRWYRETGGAAYNIRWFGAKGDAVTVDTVAIQNTVNAAIATAPNGMRGRSTVLIPIGRFVVDATISVNSTNDIGIVIEGMGAGVGPGITFDNNCSQILCKSTFTTGDVFFVYTFAQCVFRGFQIAGAPSLGYESACPRTSGAGIHIRGPDTPAGPDNDGSIIENCAFSGMWFGISLQRCAENVMTRNNYFQAFGYTGLFSDDANTGVESSHGHIVENIFFGNPTTPSSSCIEVHCGYGSIRGNKFLGSNIQINVLANRGSIGSLIINSNSFEEHKVGGVYVTQYGGTVIASIQIQGNQFSCFVNSAFQFHVSIQPQSGGSGANLYDFDISGNNVNSSMTGSPTIAFVAYGANGTISNNRVVIVGGSGYGIHVNGSSPDVQVSDNRLLARGGTLLGSAGYFFSSYVLLRDLYPGLFTMANIPLNTLNGSQIYVQDGKAANVGAFNFTVVGGGSGCVATKMAGAWLTYSSA
jgi:hypothetical protein